MLYNKQSKYVCCALFILARDRIRHRGETRMAIILDEPNQMRKQCTYSGGKRSVHRFIRTDKQIRTVALAGLSRSKIILLFSFLSLSLHLSVYMVWCFLCEKPYRLRICRSHTE